MLRNPDFALLEKQFGIVMPDVVDYFPEGVIHDERLAMDAQPALVSVSNAGIPSYLANYIDPNLIKVLVAPNKAAKIFGEAKKGDWVTRTATFPLIEHTGEVSSYGDWNENGSVGANANFPQRQSYVYQTITKWGEFQLETLALAKIDWASRLNIASAIILDKFQNLSYFFGIAGLQNYGLLNSPDLTAVLTPASKAYGGVKWVNSGVVVATANEVFTDIQSMFIQLVNQANGLIDAESKMVLALSPQSAMALTATNSFNVNVYDLLKKNFPNIRFETAPQYATTAGQLVQLICENVEGQETGYCAFNEKMRAHPIIRKESAFVQKKSQGTWGAVIFQPFAIAGMLGV